jgi:hypothetical protein
MTAGVYVWVEHVFASMRVGAEVCVEAELV